MSYLYPGSEYLRPSKLLTLALGLIFLIAGALFSGLPDWDIPVSLIMALCAYVTAAPTMRVLLEHRWHLLPHAAFWTWFSVDGTYLLYWGLRDPDVLELRFANACASLALYGMCGLVWYGQQRCSELIEEDDWTWPDDEGSYH
jgi:hypothetical protein